MYSDWTTTFFHGLAVEFWDAVAPRPSDQEIAFLQSIFRDARELLDVACGAGRFSIPLFAAGYSLSAIDGSPEFLDLARQRETGVEWRLGDIRDLPWTNRFDGALCFGNSFAYFPRRETRAFLHGVARTLRKDAAFVLETAATAESLIPAMQPERRMTFGDIDFMSRANYVAAESRVDIEYTFRRDVRQETKLAQTWIFTAAEVVAMLEDAGLAVESVYASANGDPFVLGSPRALFVTRKRAFPLSSNKSSTPLPSRSI